ncbi:MAG: peroxidase [bacterium]|nr:peroxidase [bacterium]
MPWIDFIEEDQADDELRSLYETVKNPDGGIDHILKIHGPNPPAMTAHIELYRTLMFGKSPLSRRQRETIALVVASAIDCHY